MAPVVLPLKLCGGLIAQGRMQIRLIVVRHPTFEGLDQLEGAGPFLSPQALLFEGPYDALRIRVALGVVIAGEGLMNAQHAACLHTGERGGLTPIVTHQGQA